LQVVIWHLGSRESGGLSIAEAYLSHLRDFEQKYPHFDIPILAKSLYWKAAVLAREVANLDQTREYDEKSKKAWASSLRSEVTGDGSIQLTISACSDPNYFTKEYRTLESRKWPRYLIAIIIDWVEKELTSQELSVEDAAELLALPLPDNDGSETWSLAFKLIQSINQTGSSKMADTLFGSPEPITSDAWNAHFQLFEKWLRESVIFVPAQVRHTILADLKLARYGLVVGYVLE
jgi:hypothetical protein